MIKVCVITSTRADYGILKSVLSNIDKHPKLRLQIVAAGAHYSKKHGNTYKEIKKDGYPISAKAAPWKAGLSQSKFLSDCVIGFEKAFFKLRPDVVVILGDRIEMLAAAIVANQLNIAVAHIHGGDISGTLDDIQRHAITKLSHIHFPGAQASARRLRQMGEQQKNIFVTGNPSLDTILHKKLYTEEQLRKKGFNLARPLLVLVQHPVTDEKDNTEFQINETIEAIKCSGHNTIAVFPNTDRGYEIIIKKLKERASNITVYDNLDHLTYLSLLSIADCLVGNSSSGILEAPSFKLPVVNIGDRQEGRERAENVIDVAYNRNGIKYAIKFALGNDFKKAASKCTTPYGNGTAGQMIATVLADINYSPRLLKKRFEEIR